MYTKPEIDEVLEEARGSSSPEIIAELTAVVEEICIGVESLYIGRVNTV